MVSPKAESVPYKMQSVSHKATMSREHCGGFPTVCTVFSSRVKVQVQDSVEQFRLKCSGQARKRHFYFQLSGKRTDVQCHVKNRYSVHILGMKSLVATIRYALHFHPSFCKTRELPDE